MSGKNAAFEKVYTSGDFPINIHKFQFTKTQIRIAQRHWHKSLEIGYHENTHCEIRVENEEHVIEGSGVFLINSRCIHELHNHVTEKSASTVLIIPDEELEKHIPDYNQIQFVVDEQDEAIIRYIREIYNESVSESPYRALRLNELIYGLLHYLCTNCARQKDGYASLMVMQKKDWADEVIEYLIRNYAVIRDLTEVSDYFGYSRESFCRKFRQVFHCTLHEYITKLRLREAIKQIRKTDVRHSVIAINCGFTNLRNMNMNMKSYTRYIPKEIKGLSEKEYLNLMEKTIRV